MNDYLSFLKKAAFMALLAMLVLAINPAEVLADESDTEYFRTTSNLRLRTGPSLEDDIIRTIQSGTTVRVYDQRDGEWFAVDANGRQGYMYAEFLIPTTAPVARGQAPADRPAEPQVNAYGVELIDWWDDARNNIIRSGVPLHVTDVRTGITYWVAAFSQGNHADVEPLTQEDTDAMRRAFGGSWTWTPRPIWVTVDGRTFAASINGMPHAGSTNHSNGMNGHICMHFQGSRTHNGTTSHERDHQNAVQEAFRAARQ